MILKTNHTVTDKNYTRKGSGKKKKKQDGQEKLKGNSVLKEHGTDELNQVDACPRKQKTLKVKKDMKI